MRGVNGQHDQNEVVRPEDRQITPAHQRHTLLLVIVLLLSIISAPLLTLRFDRFVVAMPLVSALGAWYLLTVSSGKSLSRSLTAAFILTRLVMLGFEPTLSDDLWRYQRDGTALRERVSPYATAPANDQPPVSSSEGHELINHPSVRSIYPPYAQFLFLISVLLGGEITWRLLVIAADLFIFGILSTRSRRAATGWLSSPLVIWEGAWNGHLDMMAATLLLIAFTLPSRDYLKAFWIGLGGGVKITPLAAALSLTRSPRIVLLALLSLLVAGAGLLPFAGGEVMPGMNEFATSWSFNSPLYSLGLAAVGSWGAPLLTLGWTTLKDHLPLSAELVEGVYNLLYPAIVTRCLLALGVLAGLIIIHRLHASPAKKGAWSVALLLLLSPTVHPWYWLVLFPLALLERLPALTALCLFAPFSYLLYGAWPGPLVWALCYGPAAAILLFGERRLSLPASASGSSTH